MLSMSNLRDLVAQSPQKIGISFGTLLRSLGVINTGIKRLNGPRWLAKHQRRLFSSGKVQILLTSSQFVQECGPKAVRHWLFLERNKNPKILKLIFVMLVIGSIFKEE